MGMCKIREVDCAPGKFRSCKNNAAVRLRCSNANLVHFFQGGGTIIRTVGPIFRLLGLGGRGYGRKEEREEMKS